MILTREMVRKAVEHMKHAIEPCNPEAFILHCGFCGAQLGFNEDCPVCKSYVELSANQPIPTLR